MRCGAGRVTTDRLPDEARRTEVWVAVWVDVWVAVRVDVFVEVFDGVRRVGLAVIFAFGTDAARAAATPLPVAAELDREPARAVTDVALMATPGFVRQPAAAHYQNED
jgi:hypothetical protein